MTDIEIKQIKKETLKLIELFKVSDKKLAIIKANDMCNIRRLYSREQIEQMQYELEELYEFTNKHVLINLSKLQKDLEQLTEHKYLLNTANKLELVIKHFWYKFFWKCEKTSKSELFIKWKNAYLDCYKKPFAKHWLDINNELPKNEFKKSEINSIDLQNQPSTNQEKLSSQIKMGW